MARETSLRDRIRIVIFEAESPLGRVFDVLLLWLILLSIAAVMLESVQEVRARWGLALDAIEWALTIFFTLEYATRLWCVKAPLLYARSFFGIVDLLSILPTYVGLVFGGAESLMVIRSLRLLRVFRVLKLAHFLGEARVLVTALNNSRRKILVFLGGILVAVVIMGSIMYLVEGPERGFTSIPRGVYWAVVTLTTVGYGDIHPQTSIGQFLAAIVMILGYGVLAVPTGIVSVELNEVMQQTDTRSCPGCGQDGHEEDASFCKFCGNSLAPRDTPSAT